VKGTEPLDCSHATRSNPRAGPGLSRIVSNRSVGPGWFLLRLEEPRIAQAARPGQFVQVRCAEAESHDPLLRRPFSIYRVDRQAGTYDILYAAVGRGSRWMSGLRGGSSALESHVSVEGPMGNSFELPGPEDRAFLVGGGVGVAPLYFLAEEILAAKVPQAPRQPPAITLCMGARTRDLLQGIEDFRRLPVRAEVSTDDGSEGFHGLVTDLFQSLLGEERDVRRVRVYGCGPQAMNESLRAILVERSLRGQICLESQMACGFGVCFGCVAPIRKEPGGEFYNRRICWDGPVFDAHLLHPGIQ